MWVICIYISNLKIGPVIHRLMKDLYLVGYILKSITGAKVSSLYF
jgi:hypothetical protein